jgi:hypothetical protein
MLVAERNGGALVRADRNGESVATVHELDRWNFLGWSEDGTRLVVTRGAGSTMLRRGRCC